MEIARDIVDAWLGATYEGGCHQARIETISEIEETQRLRVVNGA